MSDVNTVNATGATTPALQPSQPKASILSSISHVIRSFFGQEPTVLPQAAAAAESVSSEPTEPSRPQTRVERLQQSVQAGGAFIFAKASKHPIAFTFVCSAIIGIAAKIFLTHKANTQAAKFAELSEPFTEHNAPEVPCCKGPTPRWLALKEKADLREFYDQIAFEADWKENVFGAAKRTLHEKFSDPMSYINPKADPDANAFSQTEDALAPVIGGDSAEALYERTVSQAVARSEAESTSFEEAHRYADYAAFRESWRENVFGAAKRALRERLDKLSDPMSYINPKADPDANAFSQTEDALAPVIGGDSAEALYGRTVSQAVARSEAESMSFEEAHRYADHAAFRESWRENVFGAAKRALREKLDKLSDPMSYINPVADASVKMPLPTDEAATWAKGIEGTSSEGAHEIAGQIEGKALGHLKTIREYVRSQAAPRVLGEGADLRLTFDPKATEVVSRSVASPEQHILGDRKAATNIAGRLFGNLTTMGNWFQAEEAFKTDDRFAPGSPMPEGDIHGEDGYNFPGTETPVREQVSYLRSLGLPRVLGEGADLRLTFDPKATEVVSRSVASPEQHILGDRKAATNIAGRLFGNLTTMGNWFQDQELADKQTAALQEFGDAEEALNRGIEDHNQFYANAEQMDPTYFVGLETGLEAAKERMIALNGLKKHGFFKQLGTMGEVAREAKAQETATFEKAAGALTDARKAAEESSWNKERNDLQWKAEQTQKKMGSSPRWNAEKEKSEQREFHDQIAFEASWKEQVFGKAKETLGAIKSNIEERIQNAPTLADMIHKIRLQKGAAAEATSFEEVNRFAEEAARKERVAEQEIESSMGVAGEKWSRKFTEQVETNAFGFLKTMGKVVQDKELADKQTAALQAFTAAEGADLRTNTLPLKYDPNAPSGPVVMGSVAPPETQRRRIRVL